MTTVGPTAPGTVTTLADIGNAWATPNNAKVLDAAYAVVSWSGGLNSDGLACTNFGLGIPAGNVVTNISVAISRKRNTVGTGHTRDTFIGLTKDGSSVPGSNVGIIGTPGGDWPTVITAATYSGGAAYWGAGAWPTIAEINAATFGVILYAHSTNVNDVSGQVDLVTITVDYAPAPTPKGGAMASMGVG